MKVNYHNKPLWVKPWGLKEGFAISLGLFIVSVVLEILIPFSSLTKPVFPLNLFLLVFFALSLLFMRIFIGSTGFYKWLSSVKAAVPAIAFFSLVVLLMGVIPQKQTGEGIPGSFTNLLGSWMFVVSLIFLLITLGAVVAKRFLPITFKNLTFTFSHFGLWLCLATGLIGSSDKKEATLQVNQADLVWYGLTDDGQMLDLPIAIELKKFISEFHQSRLAIVGDKLETANHEYDLGCSPMVVFNNLKVKVENYLPKAFRSDSLYIDARGVPFTGPAVKVRVMDYHNSFVVEGWIAPLTRLNPEKQLLLPDGRVLRLLPPEPSYFGSQIKLYSKNSESFIEGLVEVNKPLRLDGWWVYQYSYDNLAGADSQFSTFRVVYDPWLPAVYVGFIMMLTGVMLMVFSYSIKVR